MTFRFSASLETFYSELKKNSELQKLSISRPQCLLSLYESHRVQVTMFGVKVHLPIYPSIFCSLSRLGHCGSRLIKVGQLSPSNTCRPLDLRNHEDFKKRAGVSEVPLPEKYGHMFPACWQLSEKENNKIHCSSKSRLNILHV